MEFIYNNPGLKDRRKILRNNMPEPEQIIWYYLKGRNLNGYKFRRQYSVGPYVLDFYCPELRLGIEIDGDSHFVSKALKNDKVRQEAIELQNIKIIRFKNNDVTDNIEAVIEKILEYLPGSPKANSK